MPFLSRTLIAVNVVVFLVALAAGDGIVGWMALWPVSTGLFMPWQLVTYAFVHLGFAHLLFNMYGLWLFGSELERLWGPRRFAVFYVASVLVAALAQLAVTAAFASQVPTVGASGGIFGLLLGFAAMFPQRRITPLIPPIPMPAWLFVTLYGVLELVLGVTGTQAGVAHFAHLGGLLGGWLVLQSWRGRPPFGRTRH